MNKIKLMNMYMYVLCVILCNSVIIQFIATLLVLTYFVCSRSRVHIYSQRSRRELRKIKGGGGGEIRISWSLEWNGCYTLMC